MLRESISLAVVLLIASYGQAAPLTTTQTPVTTGKGELTTTPNPAADAHKLFRHLIVGNKVNMVNDVFETGVSFAHAEKDCQNMARLAHLHPMQRRQVEYVRALLDRILQHITGTHMKKSATELEGHLLAIKSYDEFSKMAAFLKNLPHGTYWTGGKLVRFRENSRKTNSHEHKLTLSWTDGTHSDPYKLGIDVSKADKLKEGKEYCLALNILTGEWQARNCEDKLAYVCLVQNKILKKHPLTPETTKLISTTKAPEVTPASEMSSTTTVAPGTTTTTTAAPVKPASKMDVNIDTGKTTTTIKPKNVTPTSGKSTQETTTKKPLKVETTSQKKSMTTEKVTKEKKDEYTTTLKPKKN